MFKNTDKKRRELLLSDRELIAKHYSALDALQEKISRHDEGVATAISRLRDIAEYLTPSGEQNVYGLDVKIGNMIDDLRIAASRAERIGVFVSCSPFLVKIEKILGERETAAASIKY